MTQSDIAKLVGVSPQAVGKALRTGKLHPTADRKIDTQHPVNATWLADHLQADEEPDTDRIRADVVEISGFQDKTTLELEKLRQDIRTGAERERTLRIKRQAIEGTLVPRDMVQQAWARFTTAYRSAHAQFPARWSAQVAAVARTGGEPAAREMLAEAVDELLEQVYQALNANKEVGID